MTNVGNTSNPVRGQDGVYITASFTGIYLDEITKETINKMSHMVFEKNHCVYIYTSRTRPAAVYQFVYSDEHFILVRIPNTGSVVEIIRLSGFYVDTPTFVNIFYSVLQCAQY